MPGGSAAASADAGLAGPQNTGRAGGNKISNANRTRGMRLNSCEVVRESILILREGSENKMRMDVDRPAHL